jgi:type III secretion system (T3SS) inner membrane Yop/YscD-like protein/cohesin domain-containing protein
MKSVSVLLLAILLTFGVVIGASAQTTEGIWLTANNTAYKTGETVIVALNASSATPIQGFTFQIIYDPTCLKPVNAASTIPGMNALPLPQISGLADGSYASTTPQTVNGVLAEIRFTALKGCQTNLTLQSAALAIRNESGFAAPLAGVTIGQKEVALSLDEEVGVAESAQPSGSILPLDAPPAANRGIPVWTIGLVAFLLIVGILFGAFKYFGIGSPPAQRLSPSTQKATLEIKHGPNAGQSFALNKLPCYIGRDPENEICLNDPHIIDQHAKIYAVNNGYYLMDLGGETFVNGQAIRRSSANLKPGDVVRLGKSALFVFGS